MSLIVDKDNEYGVRVIGDGGEDTAGVVQFTSGATATPALLVNRNVKGSPTIAALRIAPTSTASAAVIGFGGGFISVTSILGIGPTGGAIAFDYLLPIEVNGVQRGIPLTSLASIPGAAAF